MGRKKTIDDAKLQLARALKRLKPEQGMIARRNARETLAKSLRVIRRIVDRDFPSIKKPLPQRQLSRTPQARARRFEQRMKLAGYVPGDDNVYGYRRRVYIMMSVAGVRIRRQPASEIYWIPEWVVALDRLDQLTPTKLRKLKHNKKARSVVLAKAALLSDD